MFSSQTNSNRQSFPLRDEALTDLQNICRICLSFNGNGSLFFPLSYDVKKVLESMFSLKIDDGQYKNVSKKICVPCISRVNKAIEFKEEVIKSNRRLNNIIRNRCKFQNDTSQLSSVSFVPNIDDTGNNHISNLGSEGTEIPIQPPSRSSHDVDPTFEIIVQDDLIKQEPMESIDEDITANHESQSGFGTRKEPHQKFNREIQATSQYNYNTLEDNLSFLLDQDTDNTDCMDSTDAIKQEETYQFYDRHSSDDFDESILAQYVETVEDPTPNDDQNVVLSADNGQENRKSFQCPYCPQSISTKTNLRRHIRILHTTNNPNRPHKCLVCNAAFNSLFGLARHRFVVHGNNSANLNKKTTKDPISTPIDKKCTIRFNAKASERFKCKICTQKFSCAKGLEKHGSVHDGTLRAHPCLVCGAQYKSFSLLNYHMCVAHQSQNNGNDAIPSSIDMAKETQSNKQSVKRSTSFQCPDCNQPFSEKKLMIRHCAFVHSGIRRAFPCSICGGQYGALSKLQYHQLKAHGIESSTISTNDKQYPKILPSEGSVTMKKIRLDRGKGKHACSYCGKRFLLASSVLHHKRQKHKHLLHPKKINEQQQQQNNTLDNTSTSHNEDASFSGKFDISSENGYKCQICLKMLATPETYLQHQKVHTNDRNFKCHFCDKKFMRLKDKARHENNYCSLNPDIQTVSITETNPNPSPLDYLL